MAVYNKLNLNDVGFVLWDKKGNEVLITMDLNGLYLQSSDIIEDVEVYEDELRIITRNTVVKIEDKNIVRVDRQKEVTKDNTKIIEIELNYGSIKIEYRL